MRSRNVNGIITSLTASALMGLFLTNVQVKADMQQVQQSVVQTTQQSVVQTTQQDSDSPKQSSTVSNTENSKEQPVVSYTDHQSKPNNDKWSNPANYKNDIPIQILGINDVHASLEIIQAKKDGIESTSILRPDIKPLIIGTSLPRPLMWENISIRLKERLDNGMIEEVSSIHESGISWERLEKLGLEYRFCSLYLQGKIPAKEELYEKLFIAIRQFAKRQETWFRFMEKNGVKINWLEPVLDKNLRIAQAFDLVQKNLKIDL